MTVELIRWQYCRSGYDITSQPLYAEDDADLIRAWSDDMCVVELTREGDRWRIAGSDFYIPGRVAEQLYTTPQSALDNLAEARAVTYQLDTADPLDV